MFGNRRSPPTSWDELAALDGVMPGDQVRPEPVAVPGDRSRRGMFGRGGPPVLQAAPVAPGVYDAGAPALGEVHRGPVPPAVDAMPERYRTPMKLDVPAWNPGAFDHMPVAPVEGQGMVGRRKGANDFLRGLGRFAQGAAAYLAYGANAPFVMQRFQQMREDADWQREEREQQRREWSRPKLFNTGEAILSAAPDGSSVDVLYRDHRAQQASEWERLFARYEDPATPASERDAIAVKLGLKAGPSNRAPSVVTGDDGNVYAVDPVAGSMSPIGRIYKNPPKPDKPDKPDRLSPNDVIAPILDELARTGRITPYQQQVLDYSKPRDPFAELIRNASGGGFPAMGQRLPNPPMLDANGNVPNPYGRNMPPAQARTRPAPGPRQGGQTSGGRNKLPDGYTPARARQEAAATIRRNPAARAEVLRRLQAAGVPTSGL